MESPKTYTPKMSEIQRAWWLVDAEGMVLGRLATEVARVLRGKHKTIFAPHLDTGDYVVVINADKVLMTSNKVDKTFKYRHSGYPGGLRKTSMRELLADRPDRVVENAIGGMLPHGPLGRDQLKKLKVYNGATHPHQPQSPQPLNIDHARRAAV